MESYLRNAEEHIRKVEEKYQNLNKELTEKNLAYDMLWMQYEQLEQSHHNPPIAEDSPIKSTANHYAPDLSQILSQSKL